MSIKAKRRFASAASRLLDVDQDTVRLPAVHRQQDTALAAVSESERERYVHLVQTGEIGCSARIEHWNAASIDRDCDSGEGTAVSNAGSIERHVDRSIDAEPDGDSSASASPALE